MATLITTKLQIINQVKQLLADRYRGILTVVKELAQNADDSGAKRLDLVLLDEGLPRAQHPLLRRPGLACINDGPFTLEHAQALCSLAGTSKGEDIGAVGRFGIGQKSVFHLAEVYFYLGRSGEASQPVGDVINPWEEKQWDSFGEEDQRLLRTELAPWLDTPGWLLLYLPLRRSEDMQLPRGVIQQTVLASEDLTRQLADMTQLASSLPQLVHLRRISLWRRGQEQSLAEAFLPDSHVRLSRPTMMALIEKSYRGEVTLSEGKNQCTLTYVGIERVVNDPRLHRIFDSPHWPRQKVLRGEAIADVKDKALPHGAVTILRQPVAAGEGYLQLSWAVFLPMDGKESRPPRPGGAARWHVLLHGCFFPDSGRQGAHGLEVQAQEQEPCNEEEARAQWNAHLRDRATLRCLLPALHISAREHPDDAEWLGHSLQSTDLWRQHRAAITAEHALLFGPNGCQLVSSSARALALPRMPTKATLAVGQVLACLGRAQQAPGTFVVWRDGPPLCRKGAWTPWEDADLAHALAKNLEDHLLEEDGVRYLADCLAEMSTPGRGAAICDLLRRCAQRRPSVLTPLRMHAAWQQLIALSLPAPLLWTTSSGELVAELAQKTHAVLVLPTALRPPGQDHPGCTEIKEADAVAILTAIAARQGAERGDALRSLSALAAEVVVLYGIDRACQHTTLSNLPIVRIWSAQRRSSVLRSPIELRAGARRELRFQKAGLGRPEEVAGKLLAALRDADDVLLLDEEVAKPLRLPLLGVETICDQIVATGCTPAQDFESRWPAVDILLGSGLSAMTTAKVIKAHPSMRSALRALLHGRSPQADRGEPLYVSSEGDGEEDNELGTVAGKLLGKLDLSWRLLPGVIRERLTPSLLSALGIERLTAHQILRLLEEQQARIPRDFVSGWDVAECDWLRRLLASRRELTGLWQSLPIHPTLDGRLVSLERKGVYLEAEWSVPRRFAGVMVLLANPSESVVRSRLEAELPFWSPMEQLRWCLQEPDPSSCANEVLEAVAAAELSPDVLQLLRSKPWLLTANNQHVSLAQIAELPEAIERRANALLRRDEQGALLTRRQLIPDVQQHPALDKLFQGVADSRDVALNLLTSALRQGTDLGDHLVLPGSIESSARAELLRSGTASEALKGDPAWSLLRAIREEYGDRWTEPARNLIACLQGDVQAPRLVKLLRALSEESDDAQEELFRCYLVAACRSAVFATEILPEIKLRDQTGTWRDTSQLARRAVNLQPRYLVHEDYAAIMDQTNGTGAAGPEPQRGPEGAKDPTPQRASLVAGRARAAETLRGYLEPWLKRGVRRTALGYFACIFGSGQDGSLDELTRDFLEFAPRDARENLLFGASLRKIETEHKQIENGGYGFRVGSAQASLTVESLTGAELRAMPAEDQSEILFLGEVPVAKQCGGWLLTLRELDLNTMTAEALHRCLRASIAHFLNEAYAVYVDIDRLERILSTKLPDGSETITWVRRRILDGLPMTITQLGLRRDPLWGEALNKLDEAEMHLSQVERDGTWGSRREEAQHPVREAREKLQGLLESDTAAEASMLQAVRAYVVKHQYRPAQALFELFQNADDTTAQLEEMIDAPLKTLQKCFRVEHQQQEHTLRITHWGRPINRHFEGGHFRDGRARGYGRDLLNMMELHQSEKRATHGDTGRFGLGFKSTYLLCDRPRISSADLAVTVVGGLLPVVELDSRRASPVQCSATPPTEFELTLHRHLIPQEVLARFTEIGGLLAVFARAIRVIELDEHGAAGRVTHRGEWCPQDVINLAHLEVGSVRICLGGEGSETRLLVVRGEEGAIAFALDNRGVAQLSEDIPTLWCVAPTLECWKLGFCISGPFSVDVGRGQLARDATSNMELFGKIGTLLGDTLCSLFNAFVSAPLPVVTALGLESDAEGGQRSRCRFFTTLFERLTCGLRPGAPPDATRCTKEMHGLGRGLSKLLADCEALPTELPGDFAVLTRISDVRWLLDADLCSEQVLGVLSKWPGIDKRLVPGRVVAKWVAALLSELRLKHNAAAIGWEHLLEWADRIQIQSDQQAAVFRTVQDWPARLRDSLLPTLKKKVEFRSRAGTWKSAADLLLLKGGSSLSVPRRESTYRGEEELRAAFAPDSSLLHEDYAGRPEALRLFEFIRGRFQADAKTLGRWARDAANTARQDAALCYLATGELADEVARWIRQEGRLPFSDTAAALRTRVQDLSASLRDADQSLLLARLFPDDQHFRHWRQDNPEPDEEEEYEDCSLVESPESAQRSTHLWLLSVYRWWGKRRSFWEKVYEKATYGDRAMKEFTQSLRGGMGEPKKRNSWLRLLTLGACHRYGRQRPEQPLGFLSLLENNGSPIWWQIITDRNSDPRQWIGILDEWLKDQVDSEEYSLWLGLYPTLYQFNRFGDNYAQLFLRADKRGPSFNLRRLLTPRADPALHGAGALTDAPPFERALGRGSIFVLRELVRLGILKGEHLRPYCYVPWLRLRERIEADGQPSTDRNDWASWSQDIHRFLCRHLPEPEDPTFQNSFDVPLYLALYNNEAREEVLHS